MGWTEKTFEQVWYDDWMRREFNSAAPGLSWLDDIYTERKPLKKIRVHYQNHFAEKPPFVPEHTLQYRPGRKPPVARENLLVTQIKGWPENEYLRGNGKHGPRIKKRKPLKIYTYAYCRIFVRDRGYELVK
jgi:hypothetical protein